MTAGNRHTPATELFSYAGKDITNFSVIKLILLFLSVKISFLSYNSTIKHHTSGQI